MKTTLSIMLIALVGFCQAQEIDEERMERDLKVAQNILSTLTNKKSGTNIVFYDRHSQQGSYVKGYGVILNSSSRFPRGTYLTSHSSGTTVKGKAYVVESGDEPVLISSGQHKTLITIDRDSLIEAQSKEWIEDMKTFLVDYSDLIGQLKPEDKIMITSAVRGGGTWNSFELTASGRSGSSGGPSVEISKKDVSDYKAGKINRNEALKRVKVIKAATKENVAQDVELLASIFGRLYKSDLSSTYYVSGRVNYGKIPEFGVVFDMRVYSSSREDRFHRITTQQKSGLSQEERDDIVKEMYPGFVEELKRNIAQYGRTVKSLNSDEIMMFKVRLTECKGCDIPKNIELSIKAADLQAYDSGKIDEATAMSKITVKEMGNQ